MDPATVLKLAIIAAQLSGYSMPNDLPPKVVELSSQQMHEEACSKYALPDDGCYDDIGLYRDGEMIFVDTQYLLTAHFPTENNIVVHELVHWLQYMHGYGGTECPHAQARENEAYRVQNLYMDKYEGRVGVIMSTPQVCSMVLPDTVIRIDK
jgi:hypothetical protein